LASLSATPISVAVFPPIEFFAKEDKTAVNTPSPITMMMKDCEETLHQSMDEVKNETASNVGE
jgi:hypothetical protein